MLETKKFRCYIDLSYYLQINLDFHWSFDKNVNKIWLYNVYGIHSGDKCK